MVAVGTELNVYDNMEVLLRLIIEGVGVIFDRMRKSRNGGPQPGFWEAHDKIVI